MSETKLEPAIAAKKHALAMMWSRWRDSIDFEAFKQRHLEMAFEDRLNVLFDGRGARTPCVLKPAAFCVVDHFVAEDAKRRTGTAVARSKGHITCHSRDLSADLRWENASKVPDSAKPQFLV